VDFEKKYNYLKLFTTKENERGKKKRYFLPIKYGILKFFYMEY
jgi:hypothetical protein